MKRRKRLTIDRKYLVGPGQLHPSEIMDGVINLLKFRDLNSSANVIVPYSQTLRPSVRFLKAFLAATRACRVVKQAYA